MRLWDAALAAWRVGAGDRPRAKDTALIAPRQGAVQRRGHSRFAVDKPRQRNTRGWLAWCGPTRRIAARASRRFKMPQKHRRSRQPRSPLAAPLYDLAKIGATLRAAVNRQALTPLDLEARALLAVHGGSARLCHRHRRNRQFVLSPCRSRPERRSGGCAAATSTRSRPVGASMAPTASSPALRSWRPRATSAS